MATYSGVPTSDILEQEMAKRAKNHRYIVVSGDNVVGWALTGSQREGQTRGKWFFQPKVQVSPLQGGARLLDDLIRALARDSQFSVMSPDWGSYFQDTSFNQYNHYFVTFNRYPSDGTDSHSTTKGNPDNRRTRHFWRQESKLGYSQRPQTCGGLSPASSLKEHLDYVIKNDPKDAALVVIEDAGIDYRAEHKVKACWPKSVRQDSSTPPWVIVEIGYGIGPHKGIATGALWDKLTESKTRRDRLVAVTTAEDLRSHPDIEISKNLSWERTAEDCASTIQNNPRIAGLKECRFVVVSFGPVGALVYDRDGAKFKLFFDRENMEDAPKFEHGQMWGYTSVLTSAIASEVMDSIATPNYPIHMDAAVKAGLHATRTIYNQGYHPGPPQQGVSVFPVTKACASIKDKLSEIRKNKDGDREETFGSVPVTPSPKHSVGAGSLDQWSILRSRLEDSVDATAEMIVNKGLMASLPDAPIGRYGNLLTVDRSEIESLESIKNLVRNYHRTSSAPPDPSDPPKPPAPLSIAVFGAPGSGKSYAVKQVVKSLGIPEGILRYREFNLSQFSSIEYLWNAMHTIRDDGLTGRFPIVFWDEFDANHNGTLGWLRYFLSPMQDGTFRQGEVDHPIGKSIFVFAGGISHTLRDFELQESFRDAKGPDFLSRIRGHINLLGTDPDSEPWKDRYYIIRRAILLRSMLEEHDKLRENTSGAIIDPGVLRAFLQVSRYKHGVRSLKAVVDTSTLAGADHFGRSNLPSPTQLDLHVDAIEFLSLVRES